MQIHTYNAMIANDDGLKTSPTLGHLITHCKTGWPDLLNLTSFRSEVMYIRNVFSKGSTKYYSMGPNFKVI